MASTTSSNRIAIVVSGGPAPGINAVISAATIEGRNRGWEVFGIFGGFEELCTNGSQCIKPLRIDDVSHIYSLGGSLLRTSRYFPLRDEETKSSFIATLQSCGISQLIVIGGEGSATVSYKIAEECPEISIAHIPKTIDNDIPLPAGEVSFGFETARTLGTGIIDTLRIDAKTCSRWYLVETMGRQAGFLTLGMMLASGASAILIPEEFQDKLYSPSEVAARLVPIIKRRFEIGKPYGVALLAQGILDRLKTEDSEILDDSYRDDLGRLTYSEIELGDVIIPELKRQLAKHDIHLPIKQKNVGYELRCAPPVGADIEYGRLLGFGGIACLSEHQSGAHLVCRDNGSLRFVPLQDLTEDGRIRGRVVDLQSDTYALAQRYIVR